MDQKHFPLYLPHEDSPCCGSSPASAADPHERAGYQINRFVTGFVETVVGQVPRVSTELHWRDRAGAGRARIGFHRDGYLIAPGLYCTGNPGEDSPVLVTANYKLTFDALRRELASLDAWILVLDTRGVNVWCASAHRTFGTGELIRKIRESDLVRLVRHRRLIVPQLGASGVAAQEVKKASGFTVVWGPLRAADIPAFLANSCSAAPAMRRLTFTLAERLVLSPVELALALKPSVVILAVVLILAGIGPGPFSLEAVWSRWLAVVFAFLTGLLSGAVLVPALLPWLPFRAFFIKGLIAALPGAGLLMLLAGGRYSFELIVQVLICLLISSYAAMNFTGATPYASPSGVEKEMRLAIPVQLILAAIVLLGWLIQPFLQG